MADFSSGDAESRVKSEPPSKAIAEKAAEIKRDMEKRKNWKRLAFTEEIRRMTSTEPTAEQSRTASPASPQDEAQPSAVQPAEDVQPKTEEKILVKHEEEAPQEEIEDRMQKGYVELAEIFETASDPGPSVSRPTSRPGSAGSQRSQRSQQSNRTWSTARNVGSTASAQWRMARRSWFHGK